MARQLEGRVRYDKEADSFIYEIRTVDELENGDEEIGEWGMSAAAKCWRREGAEEGEDTNFIHFDFVKTIVRDAQQFGVRLHLA